MSALVQYDRHSIVAIPSVLPLIMQQIHLLDSSSTRFDVNGVGVRLTSLRLRTFAVKGCTCVECGLVADYFAIEKTRGSKMLIYHLNLWATMSDGQDVLFTHDHIHSRGTGGADSLNNTQTMCTVCNNNKSKEESRYADALRQFTKAVRVK